MATTMASLREVVFDQRTVLTGVFDVERRRREMHALIGRVQLKPGRADEALTMLNQHGAAMLHGMSGSAAVTGRARSPGTSSSTPSGSSTRKRTPRRPRQRSTPCATCRTRPRPSSAPMSARSSARLRRKASRRPTVRRGRLFRVEEPELAGSERTESRGAVLDPVFVGDDCHPLPGRAMFEPHRPRPPSCPPQSAPGRALRSRRRARSRC